MHLSAAQWGGPVELEIAAAKFKAGESIRAIWPGDGKAYPGKILGPSKRNGHWKVKWDDGVTGTVPASKIRGSSPNNSSKPIAKVAPKPDKTVDSTPKTAVSPVIKTDAILDAMHFEQLGYGLRRSRIEGQFNKLVKDARPQFHSLNDSELKALSIYKHGNFKHINDVLRHGKTGKTVNKANMEEVVNNLDSALKKFKLPTKATVARGLALPPDVIKKMKPGTVVTDKGFGSSTLGYSTAQHFANKSFARNRKHQSVVMIIDLPKGTHAMPVADFKGLVSKNGESSNKDYETEFLLPRDQKFKIVSIKRDPKWEQRPVHIVHVKLV